MTVSGLDRLAARLAGKGAHAVVAPGHDDARAPAVVRLVAIGAGPTLAHEVVDDVLVAIAWSSTGAVRDSFEDPARTCTAVGGWRAATLLHDPDGVGAALVHYAHSFTWDRVHVECERHVAHVVTDAAARVLELLAARAAGDRRTAAVLRGAVAEALSAAMAVHHRLLAADDVACRALVASVMGPEWTRDLDIALGAERGAADFALLSLFGAAVARADRALSPQQRAATAHAIDVMEHTV